MRRDGYIIEEIVATDNMKASFRSVLRGTDRKRSRVGRYLLAHEDEVIAELQQRIADGSYRVGGYREMIVMEAGKRRTIQVIPLKDRIAVNAVMRVVDEHLHRRFIRTTAASIRNRGMHDLMEYIRRDIAQDPDGTRYCYTFDIRKFYESVDQQVAIAAVRRVFKDERLLTILDGFIHMMPHGLSMGLRSSQGLANLSSRSTSTTNSRIASASATTIATATTAACWPPRKRSCGPCAMRCIDASKPSGWK